MKVSYGIQGLHTRQSDKYFMEVLHNTKQKFMQFINEIHAEKTINLSHKKRINQCQDCISISQSNLSL